MQLSTHLARLSAHFVRSFRRRVGTSDLVRLPDKLLQPGDDTNHVVGPIIPVFTRYPYPLATHLQKLGFLTCPITHPSIPRGTDRLRICLHAGNTIEEVDGLLAGIMAWADTHGNAESHTIVSKL